MQDPKDGNYMLDKDIVSGHRENSILIRDLDGSLTGAQNRTIVKKGAYYTTSVDCVTKENWNMDVCRARYIKVRTQNARPDTYMIFPSIISVLHPSQKLA